ncbi:hypothetical protein NDU88_003877 [Pleurodeles waltl]|uniref:Uncharacterized protein n=1 Tax=Pleurodeles waltl TaxID=8319 RepID=A0AAV7T6L2_PLEWA|nr:hypothetical protein NDU88_003877 [Pleurodeles waltl]
MTQQVNAICSSCFNTLCMVRKIYKWIPAETRRTVTQAFVSSKLDYGNALYAGTTAKLQKRLHRILITSARLILDIPRHCHITAHLRDLHRLPVNKRITFKLLTHAHKTLHNTGPEYLNGSPFTSRPDSFALLTLRSPPSHASAEQPPAADHSRTSPPRRGTLFPSICIRPRTSLPSGDTSRLGCSRSSSPPQRFETLTGE